MKYLEAGGIVLALSAGNFVWQAFQKEPKWKVAFERSFFQAVAVGAYLLATHSVE